VVTAERGQITFARASTLVKRLRMVIIASDGWPLAARERAISGCVS
jgi:hypothetical protein